MKTRQATLPALAGLAVVAALCGCWAVDPCGAGLYFDKTHEVCRTLPTTPDAEMPAGDGGLAVDAGGDATTTSEKAPSSFGKSCESMTDCGGDAPICAQPNLPYCTQISCATGEANAGSCPVGFTCFSSAGNPSACLKM